MRTAVACVGVVVSILGWTFFARRVVLLVRDIAAGAPEPPGSRTNQPWRRLGSTLREFLAHTRLRRRPVVAAAHWLTAIAFVVLLTSLAQATGQLFDPAFVLPGIGGWAPQEWATELFAWAGLIGIGLLVIVRLIGSRDGRASRFYGSHQWRARYVEATIVAVCACVVALRAVESQVMLRQAAPDAVAWHYPLSWGLGMIWKPASDDALAGWIMALALAKLLVSYTWMVTVAFAPTMGVAWHRLTAFGAIWTAKRPDASAALGPLDPITVDGQPVDLLAEDIDDAVLPRLGAGTVADLSWRDRLALTSCTECGRCQAVCPAWAAGQALSPKALIQSLRDHAHAAFPAGANASGHSALAADPEAVLARAGQAAGAALVGTAHPWQISPEALWACTTCGACVAACPIQIEQLDHIVDLRRRQVLVEGDFPTELGTVFRNLERRGNPWGLAPAARLEWAKSLDIAVPVLGVDVDDLAQVDYLYWVGCAAAYDEQAQATARAIVRLLDRAGVSFAVLGTKEKCTGDVARRAGNEALFASLAQANVATLEAAGVTKIVVTCAHCYNALAGEYPAFGGRYQVVHHSELLADLIAEGRLSPAQTGDHKTVTYQDPCYLARHNGIVEAPRQILTAIGGLEQRELARAGGETLCCGAGGARAWLDEPAATRVSGLRASQIAATGADVVATACPYCTLMLTDGLASGDGPRPEVADIAQILLAAIEVGDGSSS